MSGSPENKAPMEPLRKDLIWVQHVSGSGFEGTVQTSRCQRSKVAKSTYFEASHVAFCGLLTSSSESSSSDSSSEESSTVISPASRFDLYKDARPPLVVIHVVLAVEASASDRRAVVPRL